MSLWKAELTWSDVGVTLTPNAGNSGAWVGVGLQINSSGTSPAGLSVSNSMGLYVNNPSTGVYRIDSWQGDLGNSTHFIAEPGAPTLDNVTLNDSGAAYLAGGTLSILFDDMAKTMVFSGPLGSFTHTMADVSWNAGANGPLHPARFGFDLSTNDSSQSDSHVVSFSGYWISQDGVRVEGAQLGSSQPGVWTTTPELVLGPNNATCLLTQSASGNSYDAQLQRTAPASAIGESAGVATWAGSPGLPDIENVIDLICDHVSGFLVYARVTKQAVDCVTVGYSEDQGHLWTELTIHPPGHVFCSSPSIQATPRGLLSLVFYDGLSAQQWLSDTGGRTWYFAGIFFPALPWLGSTTHPRHFITEGGAIIVTYNSGGHVKTQTFDGVSGPGFGVSDLGLAGAGTDEYPAIVATARNVIYIVWVNSGGVHEWHSETFGNSAFVNDIAVIIAGFFRVDMVYHPTAGVTWIVYQDEISLDLIAYSADNVPDFTARDPTARIIVAPTAAAQYAAIELLPRGLPIVVYQEKDLLLDFWHVRTAYSPDGGANWIAP